MKLPRRAFLQLAGAATSAPVLPQVASALDYPTRPARIIVGYAAAGPTDISGRLVGPWLSMRLGQQFVVENRPGAGSNIGTELVVRAPPDGYTLLLVSTTNAINATLYGRLNFNFIRDIAPVAGIMRITNVMVVNPSSPAKTVPDFISYAKANPGKINMGTAGVGSPPHIYGELFNAMARVDLIPVHYRGGGPALVDLLGGQVQVMFEGITSSIEYVRAGRLHALAVTSPTRSAALPDVPTVAEFVPGYEATAWFGLGAPNNTPTEIIDTLNREINAGLFDPTLKARITDLGGSPMPLTPAEFGKLIADETEKWGKVILEANIKVN
jgi:tripartite-type tricarboxylate transporter receptor subunit TctC